MTQDTRSAIGGTPQDGAEKDEAPHENHSLGGTVQRVIGAGREFVDAEMSLVRLRVGLIGSAAKWIAVFGVVAFVTAFGMIVTLMIGAVLALAPLWGLGLALLTVTGAALFAILLCGWGISAQVKRIKGIVP